MTGSDVQYNDSAIPLNQEVIDLGGEMGKITLSRPQSGGSEHVFDQIKQDKLFQTMIAHYARERLVNQDPCTLPDDLREELMRQKRKDDAFKTALCDSYRRNQTCSYGENCRFAHGVGELRLPQNPRGRNHPKYKTVLCDKFSTTGNCKYGTRCQFIHKLVNSAEVTQASGVLQQSTNLNQSLFAPMELNDISIDLNRSLPMRSDIARAFARANQPENANDSAGRILRFSNNYYSRNFLFSQNGN